MSHVQVGPYTVLVERRASRVVFGRRRREGLRLTVERDGSLKVTAPPRATLAVIENFVMANTDWIEENRDRMLAEIAKNPPKLFVEGEKFRLFGVERTLAFEEAKTGARSRAELIENYLVYTAPPGEFATDKVRAAVVKFFDQQARLHLPERVQRFAREMGVTPSGLSFRYQKTRWGSCSSRGHISFNCKVVFAPESVIDYLVIHELAHLVHADHSKKFWELVAKHDSSWRQHRRWLRDHQNEIEYLTE